jgi:hypothetical protein
MAASNDVRSFMPPGGISLHTEVLNIGPNQSPVIAHFYIVPRTGAKNSEGRPITVDDIINGPIAPSPFYIDLFVRKERSLTRINTIRITEDGDLQELQTKWLRSKERAGPVLLLRFGVDDVGEWWVIALPHGIDGRPILVKKPFSTSETDATYLRFDQVDRRGLMIIEDSYSEWPDGRDGPCHERTWISHWTSHGFRAKLVEDRHLKHGE